MSDNAYCKKHYIRYCPELSKNCPYCRIAELERIVGEDAVRITAFQRREAELQTKLDIMEQSYSEGIPYMYFKSVQEQK